MVVPRKLNKDPKWIFISTVAILLVLLFLAIRTEPERDLTIAEQITTPEPSTECIPTKLYLDSDGDTYGSTETTEVVCEGEDTPLGFTTRGGDCDDGNYSIWNSIVVYEDEDGDKYSTDKAFKVCTNNQIPQGYVANKSAILDCDDTQDITYPGSTYPQSAGGPDYNCDGVQTLPVGSFFVTSNKYYGDLGGLAGADAKCQESAKSADMELVGTWIAFISTSSTNAIDRVGDMKYVTALLLPLAENKTDLVKGWIGSEIQFTENGDKTYEDVWTGSEIDGKVSTKGAKLGTCNDWTSMGPAERANIGTTRAANSRWIKRDNVYCSKSEALYCVRIA